MISRRGSANASRRKRAEPRSHRLSAIPPREWLPDFCRVPTVFAVIVAAEIAVLVIALAPVPEHEFVRRNLIVSSLFAQWLALVTVVLLCKLRASIIVCRSVSAPSPRGACRSASIGR